VVPGILVIVEIVVLGIGKMKTGSSGMESTDLIVKGDELVTLLGVAGNGDTTDGEFQAELRFDGSGDDGVVTEDLFLAVGVAGITANTDARGGVARELGAAKDKGVGGLEDNRRDGDALHIGIWKVQGQAQGSESILDAEELQVIGVQNGRLLGSRLQSKCKDVDKGALNVFREVRVRAFDGDVTGFTGNHLGRILDPVEDPIANLLDDVVDADGGARIVETGTAMVTSRRREQGAISGQDAKGQQAELFYQGDQGVKNLQVAGLAEAVAEVGEGSLAGNPWLVQTSHGTVELAALGIVYDTAEGLDIEVAFEKTAQVEKEKGDGIIAAAALNGVSIGHDGADEREIDERDNELGETAADGTVIMDFGVLGLEAIEGNPSGFLLGERPGMGQLDGRIDFLEFPGNIG
jgi:hypothetical protein